MNPRSALLLALTLTSPSALAGEPTALDAALDHRIAADGLTDPQAARAPYEAAASAFLTHLALHPHDAQARWYLADTLHKLGRYDEALAAYDALLAMPHDHSYVDGAAYQRLRTTLDRLHSKHGGTDTVPQATVTGTTPGGQPIYELSSDHRDAIEAADAILGWTFSSPEPNAYREALDHNRAAIAYTSAQILFHHNHYPQARLRLQQVIEAHPTSIEASYSAALLVDSYVLEDDLENVRRFTRQFATHPVGPAHAHIADDLAFVDLLEAAELKVCIAALDAAERSEAMACFLAFRDRFPDSEHAAIALYNAALSAHLLQDPRAEGLFRSFAALHPEHELTDEVQAYLAPAAP